MPYIHSSSSPYLQMDNPALLNIFKTSTSTATSKDHKPRRSSKSLSKIGGIKGILQMFKLFPMLTSGCKMVALLNRPRRASLPDRATTVTIFGYKTGKVTLSIQENPNSIPIFISELPISTLAFQKEIQSDVVRIALESETNRTRTKTKNRKKRLMEEMVWSVYCNGRKMGYSIRRSCTGGLTEEEDYVTRCLKGVSMGAGVLPRTAADDERLRAEEMTYLRMRFERGLAESEDTVSFYMINPEEGEDTGDTEFSIFFLRGTL